MRLLVVLLVVGCGSHAADLDAPPVVQPAVAQLAGESPAVESPVLDYAPVVGAATIEAMLATRACVDVYHRSTWDPNDDPDTAEPPRAARLSTGDRAMNAVRDRLDEVNELGPCSLELGHCLEGGAFPTTRFMLRDDGSVAMMLHYDAGSPSATRVEMEAWSREQRHRFAALWTVPFDPSGLPPHEGH